MRGNSLVSDIALKAGLASGNVPLNTGYVIGTRIWGIHLLQAHPAPQKRRWSIAKRISQN